MLALLGGKGGGYTYRRVSWQENTGDGRYLRGGIWSGRGILSRKTWFPTEFWWEVVKGQEANPLPSFPCFVSGFMRMTVYWVVH